MNDKSIRASDIRGLAFFRPIMALLARLHQLHPSPNRTLHYDEYFLLLLLYYFNPTISSLRGLQQAAGLDNVKHSLQVPRVALGTLSEAAHVFDPEPLRGIFRELAGTAFNSGIERPNGLPSDLRLLAVDGSLWEFLPRMAAYFWRSGPRSGPPPGFKAHLHFNLISGTPEDVEITPGYDSERRCLERMLKASALYVIDRGYCDFTLMQAIIDAESSFVGRAYDRLVYAVLAPRELTAADRSAGVYFDAIARVGSAPHADKLNRPLRVIKARVLLPRQNGLNPKRGCGTDRHGAREEKLIELVLVTDRQDLSAEDIVKLYRYRWHIEIFFRWLKCSMRCKHLLSECPNGFALQLYAALIANLLIMLWTGRKPTLRTLEMLQFYLSGWATEEEVLGHIATLKTLAK